MEIAKIAIRELHKLDLGINKYSKL
jgi:hypothetical protein